MDEEKGVCQNPYWHDSFSSGTGLIDGGPYEIMHGNISRLDDKRNSLREYLIIVDRRTGRRLKVNLNVFNEVNADMWQRESEDE